MMSFEFWLFYAITIFLASIIPGPSMLLALTHGIRYGARRTMASALGNVTTSLLQAAISITGLGAVLIASATVFMVIKWLGAAYLVWMGIALWRSSPIAVPVSATESRGVQVSLAKMYVQAAMVAAGNPKAIVFFTAVFPQFIDPAVSPALQFLMLMGTGAVIAFGCFMTYAVGGQKILMTFGGHTSGRSLNRIVGGTFIGTGLGLAASRN